MKMEGCKSVWITSLHLVLIFLSQVILLTSATQPGHNSVLGPQNYNSASMKETLQRRLLKGREVIPPVSSNAIPEEPSCDELRAMWRYYKRQSRAEYTNEISQFGSNPFWDILPASPQQPRISSFGPLKGRSKARLRLKNGKSPNVYGRVVYKQEKERARKPRPLDQVAHMMGKPAKVEGGPGKGVQEPTVHLSPPLAPTKPSSLQKIKEVFREERIKDKGSEMRTNDENNKAFGRILLSPPRGMDGRVANKPRELMTPFEKIRFGHADDVLDYGTKPNLNLMAKRRTLPLHMLKLRLQHSRQAKRDPQDQSPPLIWTSVDSLGLSEDYDDNSNLLHTSEINGGRGTDQNEELTDGAFPSGSIEGPFQNSQTLPPLLDPDSISPLVGLDMPTCPEVEGQQCKMNSDCSCVGFGLYRCYNSQCQVISLQPPSRAVEETDDPASSLSSFWHSGPLEKDQLGLWENAPLGGEGGGEVHPSSFYEYPAPASSESETENRSQAGGVNSKASGDDPKSPE